MAKSKEEVIRQLNILVEQYKQVGNEQMANDIFMLIGQIEEGHKDHTQVKIEATVTIEKFNGDKISEDQIPDEVVEFVTEL